jgi:DNA-binding XRE family transcriptional regulator
MIEQKKSHLQIQLVDFDKRFAGWLEDSVRGAQFRAWGSSNASSQLKLLLESSLILVELKKPAESEREDTKSYFSDLMQLFTHQLSGSSPLFVASWLDYSKVMDQLVVDLFENMGATLIAGKAYKERLVDILRPISNRDPSSILTNVTISDEGLDVAFADRKHAKVGLSELKRLTEKTEINWNRIKIAPSRDYLIVGVLEDEDVPIPSDVIREYVIEDQVKRKREYQRLSDTTARIVGKRLRDLRELRHMTQEDLATKAQVSRWTIIRLEKGRLLPRIRALEKIAQALGTNLVSFLPS